MKELEEARQKALKLFENDEWVKWIHEGTKPAYSNSDKIINITIAALSFGKHCSVCLNLNGCCFPKNNMPKSPLHSNCHCKLESIFGIVARGECELRKFTDYIFDMTKNNGKKDLFESWGYSKIDSEWLQKDFIRQAQEKYSSGSFEPRYLNDYGQRINIEITPARKDKTGIVRFVSGWMVYPNGVIKLTTPMQEVNNERI